MIQGLLSTGLLSTGEKLLLLRGHPSSLPAVWLNYSSALLPAWTVAMQLAVWVEKSGWAQSVWLHRANRKQDSVLSSRLRVTSLLTNQALLAAPFSSPFLISTKAEKNAPAFESLSPASLQSQGQAACILDCAGLL